MWYIYIYVMHTQSASNAAPPRPTPRKKWGGKHSPHHLRTTDAVDHGGHEAKTWCVLIRLRALLAYLYVRMYNGIWHARAGLFANNSIRILHTETEEYISDIFTLAAKLTALGGSRTMTIARLQSAVSIHSDLVQPCI